jgi:FlaA1/EpsC-like NDP-sugar epimerase
MNNYYKGKTILVTGGVGSIGSEIVRKLLTFYPKAVRIMDINESGLFHMENELDNPRARFLVGDIRDKDRLRLASRGVDIIFNASALKHVPLCEYNPFEAIKTNIVGTQNIIDVAYDEHVKKAITISTDKAVNPASVMGATKLLAERITILANRYVDKKATCYSIIRFGNVLLSNGSVVPLFKQQIENGGPVTITDSEMTRFTMGIPDAVNLVLKATTIANGGEIFILKMKALRIIDLVDAMVEMAHNKSISKKLIGMRVGEKLHEELLTEEEARKAYENEEMFIVMPNPPLNRYDTITTPKGFKKTENKIWASNKVVLLSKREIQEILEGVLNEKSAV